MAFDLDARRWERLPDAPSRYTQGMTLIAVGSEAIAWGGVSPSGYVADGWSYDPAARRWDEVAPAPLTGRSGHSAVWTGERMVVWGGSNLERGEPFADGAAYDPARDRWERVAPAPLRGRSGHTAVWTGNEMIVWGGDATPGRAAEGWRADGAAYDPASDSWRKIAPAPIAATRGATAVSTGERMLVWTGSDGASYDPVADTWTTIPESPLAVQRGGTAVWSAGELLVWGGVARPGGRECPTEIEGAAYDPAAGRWRCLPESPLAPRSGHAAVALDDGMLIWGGCCTGSRDVVPFSGGAIYRSPHPRARAQYSF